MPRYVAFLRAINVGGRTVKMDVLRDLFSGLGFANVETFIASGNVIFETKSTAAAALEKKIEACLENALGHQVDVFLRTPADLQAVVAHQPFPSAAMQSAKAFNIGFCKDPPGAEATTAVIALKTGIDDFHIHGRELAVPRAPERFHFFEPAIRARHPRRRDAAQRDHHHQAGREISRIAFTPPRSLRFPAFSIASRLHSPSRRRARLTF
jgi:uncharacterized protein (DUF1697 family)